MIAKSAVYRPDLETAQIGTPIWEVTPGTTQKGNGEWVHKRLRLGVFKTVEAMGIQDALHDGMARGIRYATAIMSADLSPNQKIEMMHGLLLYAEKLGGPDVDFVSAAEFLTEALPG